MSLSFFNDFRYKRLYLGLVPVSVVTNLQEQTRQALLPTEKSMVDLTPDDDMDEQVIPQSQDVRTACMGAKYVYVHIQYSLMFCNFLYYCLLNVDECYAPSLLNELKVRIFVLFVACHIVQ